MNNAESVSRLTGLAALDHVMVAVHSHDSAIASWQRLGFKVRPVRQLAPMGGGSAGGNGGSAVVMLRSKVPGVANFIEIARADPITAAPSLKALLCGDEGVAMLVHATVDPTLTLERFETLGLRCQSFRLQFPPMGAGDDTVVDIVLPDPGQTPRMFNAMRMSNTADFERDEWRDHENSAISWSGISYIETPQQIAATAASFAKLYGVDPISNDDQQCFQFGIGHVQLEITTASNLASRFCSVRFGVSDVAEPTALLHFEVASVDRARNALLANSVKHVDLGDNIVVSAGELHGVAATFRSS
jgi:Glyoxalase-like domain